MTERKGSPAAEQPAADQAPTTPPAFTETLQIGIVVHDLDATIQRYLAYGIGPWTITDITPDTLVHQHEYGQPVAHSARIANAMVGGVD